MIEMSEQEIEKVKAEFEKAYEAYEAYKMGIKMGIKMGKMRAISETMDRIAKIAEELKREMIEISEQLKEDCAGNAGGANPK